MIAAKYNGTQRNASIEKFMAIDTSVLDNILRETEAGSTDIHLNGANFNWLTEIPARIFTFTHLTTLDVSGGWGGSKSGITHIPDGLRALSILEVLNLRNNRISALP